MQRILPHFWFGSQAPQAANLYTSLFRNSAITQVLRYGKSTSAVSGKAVGSDMTVSFTLDGQEFVALNGRPQVRFTPAISLFVSCATSAEAKRLWTALSEDGKVLMPFQEYPFSPLFGWLDDKYGLSWQINTEKTARKIRPFLMFTGFQNGKAEDAVRQYTSAFDHSEIDRIDRYAEGEPGTQGSVKLAEFTLAGQQFMAMDSSYDHRFTFTEAISLVVRCGSQEDIDRAWNTLSEGGEKQQGGWLKDRFGISWQIVPADLERMIADSDQKKADQALKAMRSMKKPDIRKLTEAFNGS